MSMKNSIDTIGNRTRDLRACSAVPQPTAPPRALFLWCKAKKKHEETVFYAGILATPLKRKRGVVNSLCSLPKVNVGLY